MSGHGRGGLGGGHRGGGHGRGGLRDGRGPSGDRVGGLLAAGGSRLRLGPVAVIGGLVAWSLLALLLFVLVGPVLGWVTGSAAALSEAGRGLATAAGAGEAVSAVEALDVEGGLGWAAGMLAAVAKPAIVIVWALGAAAILVLPRIASRLGGALSARRR